MIRAYAIALNDMLPDGQRQRLKPFILRVIDNLDPANAPARAEYLIRCAVGAILPVALEADGLMEQAAVLRSVAHDGTIEEVRVVAEDAVGGAAGFGPTPGEAAIADAASLIAQAATDNMLLLGRAIAWAAEAAAEAGNAEARQQVYDAAIETLDGVLRIGRRARPFDEERVQRAVAVFEIARGDLSELPPAA